MTDRRRIVFPSMGTAGYAAVSPAVPLATAPPAAARAALADEVPSPCVDICRMDEASGLCEGCARTIGEIAGWSQLDAAAKRAVIACLPARRAALADPFGDLPR